MALDRVKTKANAEKFLKANKIADAIRELQKLADDNPRDIQVLNQIGQLHLRVGNREMAVPCFLKVADLFSKQGFFTKAVASLKIVTREDSENLSAWEMLAGLSEQQGFAREAWSAYEKVAQLHATKGNLAGVLGVQAKLLELDPDNLKIQVQMGDNLVKAGRKEDGVKQYLKAGGKLVAQGHVKEAARMYERALQLDPTNFTALESAVKTHLAHQQGDLALQLVDSLLERNPNAEGILLLKADILTEGKQFPAAEAVCRTLHVSNPASSGAMIRLVRSLIMQRRADDASALVESWLTACGTSKLAEAEALFEEILRFTTGHVKSLEGLVTVARMSGKPERLQQALGALAESASAQGALQVARGALQELVTLEPNALQVAEKLHAVERKLGLSTQPDGEPAQVAAAPPPARLPANPPAPPVSAPKSPPAAQLDLDVEVEETGEGDIEIQMDDLGLAPGEKTSSLSSPAVQAVASPETSFARSMEGLTGESPALPPGTTAKPKGPLTPREADDIRDQLTEAEVFLKYGLVEKAIGELQAILKKVPDHVHAHQKLITIYRSQKKGDKLLRQLLKLAAIFRDQGDEDTAAHLVEEARTIDPNHKALAEWEGGAGPSDLQIELDGMAVPRKAAGREPDVEVEIPEPPAESPAGPEEVVISLDEDETAKPSEAGGLAPVEEDLLTPAYSAPALLEVGPEEGAPAAFEPADSLDLGLDQALAGQPHGLPGGDAEAAELLEEAEFYLNQELFGEAQRAMKSLTARWPDDPRVKAFREKLQRAAPPSEEEPSPSGKPPQTTEPLEGIKDEEALVPAEPEFLAEESASAGDLFPERPEEGADSAALLRQEEASSLTTGSRAKTKMKVSVKDLLPEEPAKPLEQPPAEDEYYDLASELGAALEGLQAPEDSLFEEEAKSPEEMSFEEVFEEFKKGVEKKVGEEDYATHYNLGIAYKEMELMDEAIGEFQLAARAPQYFVECCSMLGICFRQKGLNELAEKWYRKGIAAPGFAEEIYVGLKFDLADCLEEQGRKDEAKELFKEVYAVQANYRGVKERIKQLG